MMFNRRVREIIEHTAKIATIRSLRCRVAYSNRIVVTIHFLATTACQSSDPIAPLWASLSPPENPVNDIGAQQFVCAIPFGGSGLAKVGYITFCHLLEIARINFYFDSNQVSNYLSCPKISSTYLIQTNGCATMALPGSIR